MPAIAGTTPAVLNTGTASITTNKGHTMHREDYRRLSDEGLAHVTILEQRSAQLLVHVAKLEDALRDEVKQREELAALRGRENQAADEAVEAARADVIDIQSNLRRERERNRLLLAATNAFLDQFQRHYNGLDVRCFNAEFYRTLNELEELVKMMKQCQQ